MKQGSRIFRSIPAVRRQQAGFSLTELMVAVTISLLVVAALIGVFVNLSGSNKELAKTNSQIENGRFAIQLLESDLLHAGYWGSYVPQFDDLNWTSVPADVPAAVPDPCLNYANWDVAYKNNLMGIPAQSYDTAPAGCASVANSKANSDVLVVRHTATCTAGAADCDPDTAGKLYFQNSLCGAGTAGTAQTGTVNSITLQSPATATTSMVNNVYSGMIIRIIAGPGAGQSRIISTYDGSTYVATVTTPWATTPTNASKYVITEGVLDTMGFTLHGRGADCATAPLAAKRKFMSNIYYVRDYARNPGDGIPTLVRSSFDPPGPPALAHQAAEPLIEGIESIKVEFGIDDTVTRCTPNTPVDYTTAVSRVDRDTCAVNPDPLRNTLPTNRGDGTPDRFIRCTTAAPCNATDLANVVAVRLFVLARTSEPTPSYTDTKTYCMATQNTDGSCPADALVTPAANDHYKRHVFSTMVRLTTISGRRETP